MRLTRSICLNALVLIPVVLGACGVQHSSELREQNAQQAQLSAMPAPDGVSSEVWAQLKSELSRVLAEQQSIKHSSAAPLDAHSKVPDFAVGDGVAGSAVFSFSYRNTGDYDQNGIVGLADLVPVGIHFGKTTAAPDWQAAQVADGTFDGAVGLQDVTPIGVHWQTQVQGYELQVSATPEPSPSWSVAAEVLLAAGSVPGGGGFKHFDYSLATPTDGSYYRVVPFEGTALARTHGIPSDVVQFIKGANSAPVIVSHSFVEPVLTVTVSDAENDDVMVTITGIPGLSVDALSKMVIGGNGDATFTWSGAGSGTTTITADDGALTDTATENISIGGGLPAPTNLFATDGDYIDKVKLTWDKSAGATGYEIYRDAQGGPIDTVGDVNTYDDGGIADNTMHTYWLKAKDGAGTSAFGVSNDGYRGSAFASTYLVLGWNDLGMHCMNQDFSQLMILPPYNTLHAQVIRTQAGEDPQIVTGGVTVTYSIPGNTTSVGKTNFWEHVENLLGVSLPADTGLTGNGLAGEMTSLLASGRNDWNVTGIPITPLNDAMQLNSYALSRISVLEGMALVAETQAVVPVSWEISCDLCHADEQAILSSHDGLHGTDLANATPVLCGTCHGQPELGLDGLPGFPTLSSAIHTAHASRMGMAGLDVDCYACHPGQVTQCSRDVHFSAGLICNDCHGDMVAVGDPLRQPWADEPRCSNCHSRAGFEFEQAGTLYRDSVGHNGIMCAACHGSPHAITETVVPADNVQALALQGHAGMINTCTLCHGNTPGDPFNHTRFGD